MILGILCMVICTLVAYVKSVIQKSAFDGFYPTVNLNTVLGLTVFFVALGICVSLAYTGSNPFIYFQF